MHLRDVTGRHAGKGIEGRFVFLLAVADKLVISGANRVRCYFRAFIYFTLPEPEQRR